MVKFERNRVITTDELDRNVTGLIIARIARIP